MTVTVLTRKLLWGRAASHCSMQNCRRPLAHQSEIGGSSVVVGEEAHIVARSPDGPRGESPLSAEQRDEYSNLILLCPTDHALIDKAPEDFTVEGLIEIKAQHEAWVRQSLGAEVRLSDEKWAALVDKLTLMLGLDTWSQDLSPLFNGGTASLALDVDARLRECLQWIATRPWPEGHDKLRKIVLDVGLFLNELLAVFDQYSEPNQRGDRLIYPAFYRTRFWDKELYNSLLAEYKQQREYMSDLALELTRYVNYFGDLVRELLDPEYREEEGYVALQIEGGILRYDTYVPKFATKRYPELKAPIAP